MPERHADNRRARLRAIALGHWTRQISHPPRFDAQRKRVYVICGEGRIDVFQQETPDRYALLQSIKTSPGARTGLFPGGSRLYVAAPVRATSARILVYDIR